MQLRALIELSGYR